MKKIILNKAQYDYLKENNILDSYKANVINEDLAFELGDLTAGPFLVYSFCWDKTKEGVEFWNEHDEASKFLKSSDIYTLEFE